MPLFTNNGFSRDSLVVLLARLDLLPPNIDTYAAELHLTSELHNAAQGAGYFTQVLTQQGEAIANYDAAKGISMQTLQIVREKYDIIKKDLQYKHKIHNAPLKTTEGFGIKGATPKNADKFLIKIDVLQTMTAAFTPSNSPLKPEAADMTALATAEADFRAAKANEASKLQALNTANADVKTWHKTYIKLMQGLMYHARKYWPDDSVKYYDIGMIPPALLPQGPSGTTLKGPANLVINGNVISWTLVKKATSYLVEFNTSPLFANPEDVEENWGGGQIIDALSMPLPSIPIDGGVRVRVFSRTAAGAGNKSSPIAIATGNFGPINNFQWTASGFTYTKKPFQTVAQLQESSVPNANEGDWQTVSDNNDSPIIYHTPQGTRYYRLRVGNGEKWSPWSPVVIVTT